MTQTLWRLAGPAPGNLEQLEQGLRLHLTHTALLSVLMQIGDRQQTYLRTEGCDGCAHGRCAPGCYAELLRRLLTACGAPDALQPIADDLALRPYRQVAFAWPTADAQPLPSVLLAPWGEARLQIEWRWSAGAIACMAMLAVDDTGPAPDQVLRERGWTAWTQTNRATLWLAHWPMLGLLPVRRWPHAPLLLWPPVAAENARHDAVA